MFTSFQAVPNNIPFFTIYSCIFQVCKVIFPPLSDEIYKLTFIKKGSWVSPLIVFVSFLHTGFLQDNSKGKWCEIFKN